MRPLNPGDCLTYKTDNMLALVTSTSPTRLMIVSPDYDAHGDRVDFDQSPTCFCDDWRDVWRSATTDERAEFFERLASAKKNR